MKKTIFFLIFILIIMIIITGCSSNQTFEQKREIVLEELSLAIEDAKEQGKYHCCIEPACTMCYLGNWIWDDGTCDCDGMIAKGEMDKVCPQCVNGIEEGQCKSASFDCELPGEIFG
jgi:hypothetical protein